MFHAFLAAQNTERIHVCIHVYKKEVCASFPTLIWLLHVNVLLLACLHREMTFKHVEFMALGPTYPAAPMSTLNLQIKVTAQEQRARCQCCLHCVWDLRVSYPHRAWNDSENKLKGAGGAAGTSPWTRVSQTCRAFPLYQIDINSASKMILLRTMHFLLLCLHDNPPPQLLGLCTK